MLGNDESQRKKKEGERMEEASAVDVWDTDAGRSWARSQTSEGAAPSESERWGKQPWPDPNLAFSNRYLVALLLLCCSEICKRHNLPTHVITSHQSNALTYCNGNTVKRPLYQSVSTHQVGMTVLWPHVRPKAHGCYVGDSVTVSVTLSDFGSDGYCLVHF